MLIDTHCHPEIFLARGEFENVVNRAGEADVRRFVCAGTEPSDWKIYRDLKRKFPEKIAFTVGLHPQNAKENWRAEVDFLETFFVPATDFPLPNAIGEIGLDEHWLPKNDFAEAEKLRAQQREAFARQLKFAKKLGVPVVIHSREAFFQTVEIIDESGISWENVVFHCFSEGAAEMKILKEKGGRASFTGTITYKNAQNVREAALEQGLANLMLETDCPYLAPCKLRGKENEPAFLRKTAEFVAELFGVPAEKIDEITTRNAENFYRLK